jgi:ABC-2 type transport system ATP-binding protein
MKGNSAISVENVSKSYGNKQALNDLTFSVRPGSLFGFLGPNGSGKTTTINILTGILLPSAGQARILGVPVDPNNEALRKRIGVVHDRLGLFEQLTGEEHIVFAASIYGVERGLIRRRAVELLETLDLAGDAGRQISEYSHGMKKKIALASALIHDPDVIFLDEPFEGMDIAASRLVMENLAALTQKGKTIFLTSHILEIIEKICDEVAILSDGRVAFQEEMDDVIAKYYGPNDPANYYPGGESRNGRSPLEQAFFDVYRGKRDVSLLSWIRESTPPD